MWDSKIVRTLMLCGGVVALAACSMGENRPITPVEFRTPQDALTRVCAAPSSHSGIIKAVRALGWPSLARNQIPKQVIGNGMVTWTEVAEVPGRNLLVAAGQLNQTSFCRVYLRQRPVSRIQVDLEQMELLGKPLGAPDFRKRIDESDVIGWHRISGLDSRAVQLSEAVPGSANPPEMPVMMEMTRPKP